MPTKSAKKIVLRNNLDINSDVKKVSGTSFRKDNPRKPKKNNKVAASQGNER
jgi:hypothetical protein